MRGRIPRKSEASHWGGFAAGRIYLRTNHPGYRKRMSWSRWRAVVGAIFCVLLVASSPLTAQTKAPRANEMAIDHHSIRIRIDHEKKTLFGDCEIRFCGVERKKPTPITFLFLDGELEKVEINGAACSQYTYGAIPGLTLEQTKLYDLKQLTVTIPASPPFPVVRVVYRDTDFYGAATNPEDNKPFSLGQIREEDAFSSHIYYYPFVQYAGNRADIRITTDLPGSFAISSGALVEVTEDGNRRTYHYCTDWRSGILPYPFAIAKYEKLEKTASDKKTKLQIFFYPEDRAFAEQRMPVLENVFSTYLGLFGEYPFPKLAIVETDLRDGNIGLAAQSVIMLSRKVWFGVKLDATDPALTNSPLLVLADEVNHQWNAYKVGSPNYLAEGISRYVDSLFAETLGGLETLKEHMGQTRASYFSLVDEQGVEDKPITDPSVYPALYFIKGALTLHMLRGMYGYDTFKKALRRYFTVCEGKVTILDDLRASFEYATGEELTWFFDQWFKRAGWPKVKVNWSSKSAGQDRYVVELSVCQEQTGLFRLDRVPIQIDFHDGFQGVTFVCVNAAKEQTIVIEVDREPKEVRFDPEGWVLRQLK
ncbi:MAG: M1 family aminopeptidase [Thermodesulfobacteriota bacterium]|nr:M1 family aminopeptidase [Thermodesulfobacteriota bacterium]